MRRRGVWGAPCGVVGGARRFLLFSAEVFCCGCFSCLWLCPCMRRVSFVSFVGARLLWFAFLGCLAVCGAWLAGSVGAAACVSSLGCGGVCGASCRCACVFAVLLVAAGFGCARWLCVGFAAVASVSLLACFSCPSLSAGFFLCGMNLRGKSLLGTCAGVMEKTSRLATEVFFGNDRASVPLQLTNRNK